jgi:hypothetical protein
MTEGVAARIGEVFGRLAGATPSAEATRRPTLMQAGPPAVPAEVPGSSEANVPAGKPFLLRGDALDRTGRA